MTTDHVHSGEIEHDDEGNQWYACCGEVLPLLSNQFGPGFTNPQPATDLAVPEASTIEALLTSRAMPVLAWGKALLEQGAFTESSDVDPGLAMIAAILGGETSAEILAATNMRTVLDMIGDKPGAHSALLEITGAHPMASTFDDGPSCFAVISATEVASGEQFKFTCGARAVQAAILAHIYRDLMPFRAILVRRLKATRSGFYPLNLEAGG